MIEVALNKQLFGPNGPLEFEVDFSLQNGKMVAIYGDSGAGKTSLLRMISGLMTPASGKIVVADEVWFDSVSKINLTPQKRRVGFVFQDYALFPNMSVRENLLFAARNKEDKKLVGELISLFQLNQLVDKKTNILSGGQKQRVALARTLVQKPRILLLDEPLSALDQLTRILLQDFILEFHKKHELTTLIVSHDLTEIVKMCDLVIEIRSGKIVQSGEPMSIFGKHQYSGKFQFTGELLHIEKQDIIYILTLAIGANMVKVVADESEVSNLRPGDKLMVASKAFNPVIKKVS